MCSKRRERLLGLSKRKAFIHASFALALFWAVTSQAQQAGTEASSPNGAKSECARGQEVFASNCAACHGLDGKGTERAPNVVDGATSRRLSNAQISGIIRDGIAAGGMPAFHTLSDADIEAIVRYLRCQAGTNEEGKVQGDPIAGKKLFYGKATCSNCHMADGKGGFIASDLSQYGRMHSPQQVRSAIVSPKDSPSVHMRLARLTLRDGKKIVGRVRNEDNFSIQIQALDGTFHLLSKSAVDKLEYDQKLLMPADYGSVLSSEELSDLISYLVSVPGDSSTSSGDHDDDN
ncbi:MAG TPA: c-type cytochrome [Candidatus Sulfotelmatobacter sp.]|nr:c-type cytochrome [Candidatus Sulfotelmatobacter sp.]